MLVCMRGERGYLMPELVGRDLPGRHEDCGNCIVTTAWRSGCGTEAVAHGRGASLQNFEHWALADERCSAASSFRNHVVFYHHYVSLEKTMYSIHPIVCA